MKKIFTLFFVVYCLSNAVAQNNDIEAQYLYTRAEDAFTKSLFPESIDFCRQSAIKLGGSNAKITTLELQAYAGLLAKQCKHSLMSNDVRISYLIKLYVDSYAATAEKEKAFAIFKFRDDYATYKTNGCPIAKILSVESLNFGLAFTETVKMHLTKYPKLTHLSDGVFKNMTAIREGFLLSTIYFTASPCIEKSKCVEARIYNGEYEGSDYALKKRFNYSMYFVDIDHNDVNLLFEAFFKSLQINNPEMTSVKVSLSGYYGRGIQSTNYEVTIPISRE